MTNSDEKYKNVMFLIKESELANTELNKDIPKSTYEKDSETIKKFANTKGNVIFFIFYADWCGHCKDFMNNKTGFTLLADKCSKNPNVMLLAIESKTDDGGLKEHFKVKPVNGFPTFGIYTNNTYTEYGGERKAEDMYEFISNHIKPHHHQNKSGGGKNKSNGKKAAKKSKTRKLKKGKKDKTGTKSRKGRGRGMSKGMRYK